MKLLDSILNEQTKIIHTFYNFTQLIGLKVSKSSFKEKIQNHPNFPSLLAFHDTLIFFGANTFSANIVLDNLKVIDVPFIAQSKDKSVNDIGFNVVYPPEQGYIRFKNNKNGKLETISLENYFSYFTNVAVFAEATEKSGEVDFEFIRNKEVKNKNLQSLLFVLLSFLFILIISRQFFDWTPNSLINFTYYLLSFIGLGVSSILVLREADRFNPVVKQFCASESIKVNCDAVLESKGSKLFGISWSIYGFSYFLSIGLVAVVSGFYQTGFNWLIGFLTILVSPYILYSLYYQWKIVKQWCLLCLTIQGVLLVQLMIIVFGKGFYDFSLENFSIEKSASFIFVFGIILFGIQKGIELFKRLKKGNVYKKELYNIKYNLNYFESFLISQDSIIPPSSDLGIIIGNPHAKTKLLKICNPYCGPCANAHQPITELLHHNTDVQLRIIFTSGNDESDKSSIVVKHLMALTENAADEFKEQVLADWYLSPIKDYDKFVQKYPLNRLDLESQNDKLNAMADWCKEAKIQFTPTFFVNQKQLPRIYNVWDMNYLLKF